MATITITKDNFWQKMSLIYKKINTFWELKIKFEEKKDPTIRLQRLVDDPENISYGPFDNVEDAIIFLNRDLWK